MRSRKAQGATGAALLIVTLAVVIILYLLFLPDDVTKDILGGTGGGTGGQGGVPGVTTTGGAPRTVLLSQNVGRLAPPAPNQIEHTIPSFTIFTSTNAMELKRMSTIKVKNSAFSDDTVTITFPYDERSTTSPMLSFNVRKTSGDLIISLNGDEIFSGPLDSGSPPPIRLPESMLRGNNELTFKASGTGLAFWRSNLHELVNVIVSGEVTDRSASTSSQHFSISQQEYDAMQFGELTFLPNCDPQFTGRLRISLNFREIYSGFADCGVPNKIEVAKEILKPGDNSITFVSEQGQYLVDMVKLTTKIQGQDVPVFYFNLPSYIYDMLYYNDALLFITVRFADARSQKVGVLNVNGFETSFNSQNMMFTTQVDPEFLLPGPNSMIIIPQGKPLDIAELRVELG